MKRWFCKLYREKLQVVGNPIDGERIRRLSKDENVDLKGKVCNLIFVGRLVEQKIQQRFIHIVHTIKEQYWLIFVSGCWEMESYGKNVLDLLRS